MIAPAPRVKICGLTNSEDAAAACRAGADALGFNLYAGSKRWLDLAEHRAWIAELGGQVQRIAVMVNPAWDEVLAAVDSGVIDALQFHGDEPAAFCRRVADLGFPFLKAFRLRAGEVIADAGEFSTNAVLLDAFVPGSFGGTGELADFELARAFVAAQPQLRVLLSGGLNPGNVAGAIRAVRPWGVDVASGVEIGPRRKDHGAMRDFVEAARAALGKT